MMMRSRMTGSMRCAGVGEACRPEGWTGIATSSGEVEASGVTVHGFCLSKEVIEHTEAKEGIECTTVPEWLVGINVASRH